MGNVILPVRVDFVLLRRGFVPNVILPLLELTSELTLCSRNSLLAYPLAHLLGSRGSLCLGNYSKLDRVFLTTNTCFLAYVVVYELTLLGRELSALVMINIAICFVKYYN